MGDMLFVEGRRHDIITRGSLSFYPAWLEAAIEKCPGVVQAIVVGIPHEKLHQEICACVLTSNKDLTMTTVSCLTVKVLIWFLELLSFDEDIFLVSLSHS